MSTRRKHNRPAGHWTPRPAERHGRGGMSRRVWLGVAVGGVATALVGKRWWHSASSDVIPAGATVMTVYADPGCDCCHKWIAHLERNHFHVTVESVNDVTPVKRKFGIPESVWSCHTGMVNGYAIEGHVPADLIQKMLAERPAIAGLAAPGMPNGAPGMEGGVKDRYEIMSFTRPGATHVYAVR